MGLSLQRWRPGNWMPVVLVTKVACQKSSEGLLLFCVKEPGPELERCSALKHQVNNNEIRRSLKPYMSLTVEVGEDGSAEGVALTVRTGATSQSAQSSYRATVAQSMPSVANVAKTRRLENLTSLHVTEK